MNKEVEQDRVFDTTDHFNRFGYILFKENIRIYENIGANLMKDNIRELDSILEAGCGQGIGSQYLWPLSQKYDYIGTDKLKKNVEFAKALHPWTRFDVWDMTGGSYEDKADVVVCVEAIEHVTQVGEALKNMIASAKKEVWFSTPNNYEPTPSNPFHVREYTVKEMYEWILRAGAREGQIKIYHWDTMEELSVDTRVSPLIYRICLNEQS